MSLFAESANTRSGMLRQGAHLGRWMALALPAVAGVVHAEVRVPSLVGNHMVLQRDRAAIWGSANPGESVTVVFQDKTTTAKADKTGHWRVKLAGLKTGAPQSLLIKGENEITIEDVLVGDVWVCGGQSNMESPLSATKEGQDIADGAQVPTLRAFLAAKASTAEPAEELHGEWIVCTPANAGRFSALGLEFGNAVTTAAKIPVGLVQVAVGGTPAEAWTPTAILKNTPTLSDILGRWDKEQPEAAKRRAEYEAAMTEWQKKADEATAAGSPAPARPSDPTVLDQRRQPSGLYNGMIAPLAQLPTKGVIWFQGEANVTRPTEYKALFPAMIRGWRSAWSQGDFPFLFVQLPGMFSKQDVPSDSHVAELREAQTAALAIPNTVMAPAIDLGQERAAQLPSKHEIGKRLADLALSRVYGTEKKFEYPSFGSLQVSGNKAKVKIKNTGAGLADKNEPPLKGFAIAGADRAFAWATAEISGDTITVSSPYVPKPTAVRYGWADFPEADVQSKAGLPLIPFRTDTWDHSGAKIVVPEETPQPSATTSGTNEPQAASPSPAASGTPEASPTSTPAPAPSVTPEGSPEPAQPTAPAKE